MIIERGRLVLAAYLLGILGLIGAGLRYLFVPQFDLSVQVLIAAGVVLLAAGVLLDPERVRRALTGRQARHGSNALLLSLAVIGILSVINVLVVNNPQRLDLTEDQEFSLAPESELLLAELSEAVRIIGFYTPEAGGAQEQIRPILDEYQRRSNGNLEYEFVDPRANPVIADQYGVTRDASMVVIMGGNSHVIDFPSETELTSALVRLSNPEASSVYFVTGHGERNIESSEDGGYIRFKEALESKNYIINSLNLLTVSEVPDDAVVLVIAGPQAPMQQEEVELLDEYLSRGGAILLLNGPDINPGQSDNDDALLPYLKETWGLTLRDDFVIDLNSAFPSVGIADTDNYGNHPITARMQNLVTLYPTARSLDLFEGEQQGGKSLTPLVLTGQNSWGESDIDALVAGENPSFDESSDTAGPLIMGAVAEDASTQARLVVIGDADFAANADFFTIGNGDLVVNSVDWAARLENLISITPRERTTRQVVPPTRETVVLITLITVVVIPGAFLALGGYLWWDRRKRA